MTTENQAKGALESLVAQEPEWAHTFQLLCESAPRALEAQTFRFADELGRRRAVHDPRDVSDALFDLAAELCPDSPAADPEVFGGWALGICRQAVRHVAERGGGGDARLEGAMEAAWGSRAAYRRAARGWVAASVREAA